MEFLSTTTLLALALLLLVIPKIYKSCWILVWRPWMLSRKFMKQGISGPKYKILHGNLREIRTLKQEAKLTVLDLNSNDIFPRVLPHFHQWRSQYGTVSISLSVSLSILMMRGSQVTNGICVIRRDVSLLARNRAEDIHLRS